MISLSKFKGCSSCSFKGIQGIARSVSSSRSSPLFGAFQGRRVANLALEKGLDKKEKFEIGFSSVLPLPEVVSTIYTPKRLFSLVPTIDKSLEKDILNRQLQRLQKHFSYDQQTRCRLVVRAYLNELSDEAKNQFLAEFGSFDSKKDELSQVRYVETLLSQLSALDPERKIIEVPARWLNYPLPSLEVLMGIGKRYSSSCAAYVARYLPTVLTELYGGAPNYRPIIVEFGGFAFSDSALFLKELWEAGIYPSQYKGVDVFHLGVVAANTFNQHIGKFDGFKVSHNTAEGLLVNLVESEKKSHKVFIALRFLAVLKEEEIKSFFYNLKNVMSTGDMLIFNYTEFNEAVYQVGSKPAFVLENKGGMAYISHKDTGDHLQTCFDKNAIDKLLKESGLMSLQTFPSETLSVSNSSTCRTFDPYKKHVVAVLNGLE